MNLSGIVLISLEMTSHHGFNSPTFEVGPRKGPGIEQYFTHILRQGVPIPDPKMKRFVPAKKQPLEVKR